MATDIWADMLTEAGAVVEAMGEGVAAAMVVAEGMGAEVAVVMAEAAAKRLLRGSAWIMTAAANSFVREAAIDALLWGMTLLIGAGCSFPGNQISGKSWSQTAAREEQEQQINAAPEGDLPLIP